LREAYHLGHTQTKVETIEVQEVEPTADYNLHIKVLAGMRPVLRDAAQPAYQMRDTSKSDLFAMRAPLSTYLNAGRQLF